jgi:apolipoprotein N-acyltransferase
VPRHEFTSLAVRYGFNDDLTFYTRFGDVFALLCGILSLATIARAVRLTIDRRVLAVRAGAPSAP